MQSKPRFFDVFQNYKPDAKVQGALEGCLVDAMAIDNDRRLLNLTLHFPAVVDRRVISHVASDLQQGYDLHSVRLQPRFSLEALSMEYIQSIKRYVASEFPSCIGYLAGSEWQLDGDALTIHIKNGGAEKLEAILPKVERVILSETGILCRVSLCGNTAPSLEEAERMLESRRKEVLENMPAIPSAPAAGGKGGSGGAPSGAGGGRPKRPPQEGGFRRASAPKALKIENPEDIIMGKPTDETPTPMKELGLDMGRVTVKGDIFAVEIRDIPAKNLKVVTFDMTDYTDSVHVVKVVKADREDAEQLISGVKKGLHVVVQGSMGYSTYDRSAVLTPVSIRKAKKQVRMDNAAEKRVELHLHSNMSTMDGITDIADLVARAKLWGHKAVAITDHGVAQGYPAAMNAGKKHGIKILYGVEAYYVNNASMAKAVTGKLDASLDEEYIAFDIETTGLNPERETIIEIAAALVRGEEIVDRFQTYVNPNRPIPAEITKLTGIDDSMVRRAPELRPALEAFLAFAGERPLAAHNASFDISFIRLACRKFGIEREFTYVDTLEMARILLPHLNRHKLNIVAEELHLGDFDHHKASEDTEVLAKILIAFFVRLKQEQPDVTLQKVNGILTAKRSGDTRNLRSRHLIILVKNYTGLKNLYQLITESHLTHYKKQPIIPRDLLEQYREGLILGSACEAGELFEAVAAKRPWKELIKIAGFYDFLEIQPIGNNAFMLRNGSARDEEELREFNRIIVKLADALGKPVVATGDVHFLEPHDEVYRRILMASKGFTDADEQAPLYFKTTDEMLEEFSYLGAQKAYDVVVKNTNLIADMCEDIQPVPDGQYPPKIEGSAEDLRRICNEKLVALYGENPDPLIRERLDIELNSIISHGYDVMYIIAQKLVWKSLEDGYLVGSRGSVGSSIVAFFAGITEVNALPAHYRCPICKKTEFHGGEGYGAGVDMPDKNCPDCGVKMVKDGFDIPFATFLGFNADKTPDIDLNFSGEYQATAHKQTIEIFGEGHVFRAGTIGTVAEKTAYGYVKKYLEERGLEVGRAEENRLTLGCTGVKRTTGQHPGGVMVVPRDRSIFEFCPVQHPADDPNSDIVTTHFDYHSIHDNLLKLDLLGHDDPTMIRMLEDLTGVNAREIPLDDPETVSIFTSIHALGIDEDEILGTTGALAIPEFGKKFVRGMLLDTRPKSFDEFVRISGLSHGTDVWLGNAQELIENKVATLKEVICARDDIMLFLISKGVEPKMSFTIMESVRKGKGLKPEFEEAMRACDVPEWYIDSCKKIKYMFPKAHAVAYVMMAFRIAWFKVHIPLAFYSAYFSIRANGFDASIMTRGDEFIINKMKEINELEKPTAAEKDMLVTLEVCHEFYRRGFKFYTIDVYRSDSKRFIVLEDGLLPPFTSMPGVGESAADSIVEERENGEFLSVDDMVMRCGKVSSAVVEALRKCGALDDMPATTQVSFF